MADFSTPLGIPSRTQGSFLGWGLLIALILHALLGGTVLWMAPVHSPSPVSPVIVDIQIKPKPPALVPPPKPPIPVSPPLPPSPPVSPPKPPVPSPPKPPTKPHHPRNPGHPHPPVRPPLPPPGPPGTPSPPDAPQNPAPGPAQDPTLPSDPLLPPVSPGPKLGKPFNPFPGKTDWASLPGGEPSPGPGLPDAVTSLRNQNPPGNEPEPNDYRLEPDEGGGLVYTGRTFTAHILKDGRVSFNGIGAVGYDKKNGGLAFDISDIFDRASGHDPYGAAKQRFLKKTQELREKMRKEALEEQKLHEHSRLAAQLNRVWKSGNSLEKRHRALFDLWVDRGDEPEPSLAAGARAEIEDYIRAELPAGSSDAYTEEELSALNQELREQGFRARFRPY